MTFCGRVGGTKLITQRPEGEVESCPSVRKDEMKPSSTDSPVWQVWPEKPCGQAQKYLSGSVFMQVPPLRHGWWRPQGLRSGSKRSSLVHGRGIWFLFTLSKGAIGKQQAPPLRCSRIILRRTDEMQPGSDLKIDLLFKTQVPTITMRDTVIPRYIALHLPRLCCFADFL